MTQRHEPPWWGDSTWCANPQCLDSIGCDLDTFRRSIDHLREIFDRSWWSTSISDFHDVNPVAASLMGGGLIFEYFAFHLGADLLLLAESPGIGGKVRHLKLGHKVASTLFELRIASAIALANIAITLPSDVSTTRTPDIIARSPAGEVAIECKILEETPLEAWIRRLMSCHYLEGMNGLDIELAHDLPFIRRATVPGWDQLIAEELVRQIQKGVRHAREQEERPTTVHIDGIATIRFHDNVSQRSASGPPLLTAAMMRRVVELVEDAAGQIPENAPGIVVIKPGHLPGSKMARAALDAMWRQSVTIPNLKRVHAVALAGMEGCNFLFPGLSLRSAVRESLATDAVIGTLARKLRLADA